MYIDLLLYKIVRKEEKDLILRKKREFGYDTIIGLIHDGYCIDITKNHKDGYNHQHILILLADQYIIEVPCVIIDKTIHLITFYVSRSAKKAYKDFIPSK
jgi:hypothetical protein